MSVDKEMKGRNWSCNFDNCFYCKAPLTMQDEIETNLTKLFLEFECWNCHKFTRFHIFMTNISASYVGQKVPKSVRIQF